MTSVINNTAIRILVLINNNRRKFRPLLSNIHVSKFQNDLFTMNKMSYIQLSSNFLPISMWSGDSLEGSLGSVWTAELHKSCNAFRPLTPDLKHKGNLSNQRTAPGWQSLITQVCGQRGLIVQDLSIMWASIPWLDDPNMDLLCDW